MSGTVSVASIMAQTFVVEANSGGGSHSWQPQDTSAAVDDVVEWKLGIGNHGVRITNWSEVKPHVDVETVPGQQPFNATTGRNDNPTTTAGKVLARLKIKSVPPVEIKFNCIVHGATMSGTVSVA
jgi:hypothetical protein